MDAVVIISTLLGLSILALVVVLVRSKYRPKYVVKVAEHDGFAWFFQLPDGKSSDKVITRYGFLVYISMINKGFGDDRLERWYLQIKASTGKPCELKPVGIPEPEVKLGKEMKTYPVLWQRGLYQEGNPMLESDVSISGVAYFVGEFYSDNGLGFLITNDTMRGKFIIETGRDERVSKELTFNKVDIGEVRRFVDDIDKADLLENKGIKA